MASTSSINILPIATSPRCTITQEDSQKITEVAVRSANILSTTQMTYVKSLPASVLLEKGMQVGKYVTAGASVGGSVGMGVAICTGPGFPIVAPIAVPVGCGIGAASGLIYGTVKVKSETRLEFESWKKSQNAFVLRDFKNMFKEHPDLSIALDPLSLEPMITPAHCNCSLRQHTFELLQLQKHVSIYGNCPDPDRFERLTLGEIRIDYKTMGLIHLAYRKFLLDGARASKLSPHLMKGVEVIIKDLTTMKNYFFKLERDDINARLDANPDDPRVLTQRLNDIASLLYVR